MNDRILIVGNGILGTSLALELLHRAPQARITLVGETDRPGSATTAAGAMLNSFAELEAGALDLPTDKVKFDFSREASRGWEPWLERLRSLGASVSVHWGTILLNNAASNGLDDANFEAILGYLREFSEPFENLRPEDIPSYRPEPRSRALRAIFLPREGYLNPVVLLKAMDSVLARSKTVTHLSTSAQRLLVRDGVARGIVTREGEEIETDILVVANGAACSALLKEHEGLNEIPRVFYGVGSSVLVKTGDETPVHVVRTPNRGLACGIYQVPYDTGVSCIGATNFISPEPELYPKLTSIESLMRAAMEQLNVHYYKAGLMKVNVGFRPTTADTYPLLGATPVRGLYVMSGTKRDGIHCAPIWAREMASMILGEAYDKRLDIFRPVRPLIRELSRERGVTLAIRHLLSAAYQHELALPKLGWGQSIEDFLRLRVEDAYTRSGVTDFGIPPELLEMYRYGHIKN